MRATRLQSASKRPPLAAADPLWEMQLGSGVAKKEEEEEEDAGATTRKRAKTPSTPLPLTPAALLLAPPSLPSLLSPPSPLAKKPAVGLPERLGSLPLRCVLTGTNPSATAWNLGHAYAHRSNRFWPLLHSSPGLVPPRVSLLLPSNETAAGGSSNNSSSKSSPFSGSATDDELLAEHAGLGLCDVGTGHPETKSSAIPSAQFAAWAPVYYGRLVDHVRRAARGVGCRCRLAALEGEEEEEGNSSSGESHDHPSTCCAPLVVAFTGKRQFVELLNAGRGGGEKNNKKKEARPPFDSSSVSYGLQPRSLRPRGWPRCLSETEVWVLTTTSGAAGLTNEARAAPYLELGRRLAGEEWPRPLPACCRAVKKEEEK